MRIGLFERTVFHLFGLDPMRPNLAQIVFVPVEHCIFIVYVTHDRRRTGRKKTPHISPNDLPLSRLDAVGRKVILPITVRNEDSPGALKSTPNAETSD